MNTPRVTRLALGGLCALLGLGMLSCQDRDFGLTIRQVQPVDLDTCEVELDESIFQSAGSVDMALRTNYFINVRIENNLLGITEVKGFDESDSRVNTSDVVLRSATIEYTTLDTISTAIQSPIVVPLSGTVQLNAAVTVGVEVLNSAVLAQLRDADEFLVVDDTGAVRPVPASVKLIARIRIAGETLDGKAVESNEFLYPVDVCNGCLITYPSNLLETRNGQLSCPGVKLDAEGNPIVGPAANATCFASLGVDGSAVDCQTCQGLAVNSFARQLCQPDIGE